MLNRVALLAIRRRSNILANPGDNWGIHITIPQSLANASADVRRDLDNIPRHDDGAKEKEKKRRNEIYVRLLPKLTYSQLDRVRLRSCLAAPLEQEGRSLSCRAATHETTHQGLSSSL